MNLVKLCKDVCYYVTRILLDCFRIVLESIRNVIGTCPAFKCDSTYNRLGMFVPTFGFGRTWMQHLDVNCIRIGLTILHLVWTPLNKFNDFRDYTLRSAVLHHAERGGEGVYTTPQT